MATIASVFRASLAASTFTASVAFPTWNGPSAPGRVSIGMSSFENPIRPSFAPWKLKIFDGDHSAGVLPAESTIFAETYGKLANGLSVNRMYSWLTSKLWFPSPSAEKPIRFMNSIVGLSPKNAEIGGVAPTASPAVTVSDPFLASRRKESNHGFRNADPPIANVGPSAVATGGVPATV
jgi:hypothetical protein